MFRKIGEERAFDGILKQIIDNIQTGKLKAGDALPAERTMAETMGVSRAAVRAVSYTHLAYLSGIKVDRIKTYAFMLCAMLASVAAMIHAAQISQGGPNEGQGYELNAVAACAIGGTSLAGGKGTLIGTLVGALILGMLDNVLGLKGVNSNLQLVVKGFLIIIAVFMQADKVKD